MKDEDEVNTLRGIKIGEWSFKVIHDVNYEIEREQAWAVFKEMENDPTLQISTFDMSSKEVTFWVRNRTPENEALEEAVILNRTVHIAKSPTPPPTEKV
jgi:hypothetical protein